MSPPDSNDPPDDLGHPLATGFNSNTRGYTHLTVAGYSPYVVEGDHRSTIAVASCFADPHSWAGSIRLADEKAKRMELPDEGDAE